MSAPARLVVQMGQVAQRIDDDDIMHVLKLMLNILSIGCDR